MANMTMKQYSLLDYTISITLKKSTTDSGTKLNIPIGGAGNYLGSIKFAKDTDRITKTVDATGAGVFSFSNDHSGTVDIEITQVSDAVNEIIKTVFNKYITGNDSWKETILDITLYKGTTQPIIEATNCMLVKMPDLEIGNEVATRTFSFVAMEIHEKAFTY